jgi:hypothetical protein
MKQTYEITVQGHLTARWREVIEEMEIAPLEDGNTQLRGELPDQAALYGLLRRLSDLGMTLISVNPSQAQILTETPVKKS